MGPHRRNAAGTWQRRAAGAAGSSTKSWDKLATFTYLQEVAPDLGFGQALPPPVQLAAGRGGVA